MMSIPDFIQGIDSDNPSHDVAKNFGKLSVLYNLLGGRSDISISSTHENGTMFHIGARNKTSARSINDYINGVTYTVYGCQYYITSICEQKTIDVIIKKR